MTNSNFTNRYILQVSALLMLSFVLFACGTVPVPGLAEYPVTKDTDVASNSGQDSSEQVTINQQRKPRKLFNTARGYWLQAVRDLQVGEVEEARLSLMEALTLDPDSNTARKLLSQLDADPVVELGNQNFPHKVGSGESLSVLAKNFLNDPLKFHILARYNNIDNPSKVRAGQTILIPGAKKQELANEKKASELEIAVKKANVEFKKKRYSKVIAQLEGVMDQMTDEEPATGKANELLASSYLFTAEALIQEEKFDDARVLVEKAEDLQADNPKVAGIRQKLADSSKSDAQFEEGMLALNKGDKVSAYEKFDAVLKVKPNHRQAARQASLVRAEVGEIYYREALKLQRKQKLKEAIVLWDKVLAIDPENKNAGAYRAKAEDLDKKLEQFAGDAAP
ncbi:MAG: LysM peptidoglycan-binding domain-containing protein [Gammaproteobacteria bacterium]|nr:LysM peptidoglycan-binding domain-containing protein [Gammaproteobacteria bacterium]